MKRRKFLKTTGAAVTLPILLNGFGIKAYGQDSLLGGIEEDRVMVLIQLNGGNDGLNTVIPTDQYTNLQKARTNVLIPENKVLKLKNQNGVGLHPKMTGLKTMFDNDEVCIVQSVGYDKPNFSHFRSTDIWNTGSDRNEFLYDGWMGRYLADSHPKYPTNYPNSTNPDPLAIQIGGIISPTLQGPLVNMGMAVGSVDEFYKLLDGQTGSVPNTNAGKELKYVRQVANQTNQYIDSLKTVLKRADNLSTLYPSGNPLANQLKIVARLIGGGAKTKVYMVNLNGFDTHSQQVDVSDNTEGSHARLMERISTAVFAFFDDLKKLKVEERVAAMTVSEFGRRIKSNASSGTDHGAAAPLMVFGTGVNAGIIGANPTIGADVKVSDNIPFQYDFKQIYTSVFQDWFKIKKTDAERILEDDASTLPIFDKSVGLKDYAQYSAKLTVDNIYPNPIKEKAIIEFSTDGGEVRLQLFDALGRKLQILDNKRFAKGTHKYNFERGRLPAGNYYLQVSQNDKHVTKQLVLK